MPEQQQPVAVVIGGASGIGAACAVALRDDGCRVVVADLPGTPCDVEVRARSTRACERRA
jgi:NAD(P)-dependent dehydrogenase (short-subunit alcohol dehydrogenase family)